MLKGSKEAPNASQSGVFPIRASDVIIAKIKEGAETQTETKPDSPAKNKGR